jgi:hypothetical protein
MASSSFRIFVSKNTLERFNMPLTYTRTAHMSIILLGILEEPQGSGFPAVYFFTVSLPFCGGGNCLLGIVNKLLSFAKSPERWQAKDASDLGH